MIIIDSHYNGPHGIGHGGVSAGRFAEFVDPNRARVRFAHPVPLGLPLDSARICDGLAEIRHGGDTIATVRALDHPLEVGDFATPTLADVERAEPRWLEPRGGVHMAPACFACGHERDLGGLGLRPAELGDGVFACRWRPEGSAPVPPWLVWTALDCPTGFPAYMTAGEEHAVVTGELAVEILGRVDPGTTLMLVSRVVAREGRRNLTEAALLAPDGRRLAIATAVWVTVPLARLRPDTADRRDAA